ncbi:bifunctional homocysteine S-methyltransferase/methylenetetrahydrofolate reductase [candidate division KSB1 bacterium]|nr:bifunctional homocysteine S-methyltransferase/methylenetetrahydrofolate reductase [candidate division KSB1 bacterium]
MKTSIIERLKNEILVADGAMGTMLYAKGVYINRCFDELNLSQPKTVADIHKAYIEAGADIIETNTFGANRFKLAPHGLDDRLYDINFKGAHLAREVAGDQTYVAGSIGPLGWPIKPLGTITQEQAHDAFAEQAKALHDGNVDVFLLETFCDLTMLEIAIQAVQSVSEKPIIAHVSFSDDARTIYGVTPAQVVERLNQYQLAAIGVNCSTGPQPIFEKIVEMAKLTSMKLSAMPNAGMPKFVEGRLIYMASPEYFAEYAKRFIQSGVSIVGGCCGTTPEHIRAIKAAVKALRPAETTTQSVQVSQKIDVKKSSDAEIKSELHRKLSEQKFVTCIEINPPRSPDVTKVLTSCRMIRDAGVDAVNIPDGPRASARMSPLALAALIQSQVKIDTILHYTCRDRNILGMQSDLLGAAALGLRNILSVTGDPPKLGDYPTATAVFNVDAIGLLRIASNLNNGNDLAGNPIEKGTSFFLGAGANPGAINFDEEINRLHQKIDAGAQYILTQPLFDMRYFDRFMDKVAHINVPILAGILPLASFRNAEFLHNEVPGMEIPQPIRDRMGRASDKESQQKIGIEVARQMLEEIRPQVQGVYLMPPFGRHQLALEVLEVLK